MPSVATLLPAETERRFDFSLIILQDAVRLTVNTGFESSLV